MFLFQVYFIVLESEALFGRLTGPQILTSFIFASLLGRPAGPQTLAHLLDYPGSECVCQEQQHEASQEGSHREDVPNNFQRTVFPS